MTGRLRWGTLGVALGLVLLAAPSAAWAGPAADQLSQRIDRVLKVLEDPELMKDGRGRDRRAAIRRVAEDIFDFQEISARSLGRHWQARTPAERDEFVRLFGDLLEHAWVSKIELYSGEKVSIVGESTDGDYATVRTLIASRQGPDIPVDYRLLQRGARWIAYDVSVEGVSLVANYRSQFNTIIGRSSYGELVQKLREMSAARAAEPPPRRPAVEAGAAPPSPGPGTLRQAP